MERPLSSILLTTIILAAQSFVKVTAEGDFITEMQNKSREMRSQTLQMPLLKNALQIWYQSEACPSPWVMFKGLCFLVRRDHPLRNSPEGYQWFISEVWCNARGGFLVYFHNEAECKIIYDFLVRTLPDKWIHIGVYVGFPQHTTFSTNGIQFGKNDLKFLHYIPIQKSLSGPQVFQVLSRPAYKTKYFIYTSSKHRTAFTVCRRAL